ncbi:lipopolysaccharide biosynthesis protein [Pseudarthrobacter sp. NPDC058362]|uniref:lipopolysaccharide biosynthesis protein n=1 Tax=Pseudarthrobacter sp. NPDC058362 TaxID=3346458 RepID=UPI00364A2657
MADSKAAAASPARQSAYYLLGAALQGTGALLVQPFSIRILDPTEWGRVGLSAVLLQVGQVVLSAGLPLAITRAYFTPKVGRLHARAIHGANTALSLGISIAAASAYYLLSPDRESAATFAWAIAATGLLSVVVGAQAILRSQRRALSFMILSGGASLGAHLFGLLAIAFIGADSVTYLIAFTIGMLVTAGAAFALASPLWPGKAWPAVKGAFRLGLPVVPHSMAIMLLMQGDSFLLQHFQNSGGVGRYVAAAAFALGPFAVLSALNNVWTARIFEASQGERLAENIRAVGNQAAIMGGAIAIGGSAAATLGMLVLKGDDHEVMQLAKVLPGVACGYALYLVAMSVMFARQKTGAFTWVTPLVLIATIGVAVLPAQSDHYWLLGTVKAASFAGLGVAYYIIAARMLPASIPLRTYAVAALGSAVCIGGNFLLPTTAPVGAATISVAAIAAVGCFLAARRRGLASW